MSFKKSERLVPRVFPPVKSKMAAGVAAGKALGISGDKVEWMSDFLGFVGFWT